MDLFPSGPLNGEGIKKTKINKKPKSHNNITNEISTESDGIGGVDNNALTWKREATSEIMRLV